MSFGGELQIARVHIEILQNSRCGGCARKPQNEGARLSSMSPRSRPEMDVAGMVGHAKGSDHMEAKTNLADPGSIGSGGPGWRPPSCAPDWPPPKSSGARSPLLPRSLGLGRRRCEGSL